MKIFAALALAAIAMLAGSGAQAQEKYPSRPIRLLVPYPPGGSTDIVARPLAEYLRRVLNQPVVVENKPGAFGIIAIQELARSKPDGYTLMVGFVNTNAITPVLFAHKLNLDYSRDVVPVMRLVEHPTFLSVTANNFAPKTVAELVAYAKQNPGKVRYGSVGVGSSNHIAAAAFASQTGIDLVHVPNRGGAAMTTDLVRGDVQMVSNFVAATAMAMVKSGQVRPLAVDTALRLKEFPDVPTMVEAGTPPRTSVPWQGVFAPAGTPREVLDIVRQAFTEALADPQVLDLYAKLITHPVPTKTLDEAQTWLRDDMAAWATLIKEFNIKPEE